MKFGVSVNQPDEEDVYDWHGAQLNPDIRQHLTVNHVVRIQVNYPENLGEAIYVQINEVVEDDLIATVLDTYRHFLEDEIIYVENGDIIRFSRACVMEVPIDWNPDLKAVARFTGLGRSVTGMLPKSD